MPDKTGTKYSALDVMKQGLELLFEFSPSEHNYREAMRTIQVYSEGDEEMLRTLRESYKLIANAVYNAYIGQRHAESISPELLFLQGIHFDTAELQQSFRYVGVRPPDMSPPSVRKTVFLDEGFEPYKLLLDGKLSRVEALRGREEHWAKLIEASLPQTNGAALIRADAEQLMSPGGFLAKIAGTILPTGKARIAAILHKSGIEIRVVHRTLDINRVFGKR